MLQERPVGGLVVEGDVAVGIDHDLVVLVTVVGELEGQGYDGIAAAAVGKRDTLARRGGVGDGLLLYLETTAHLPAVGRLASRGGQRVPVGHKGLHIGQHRVADHGLREVDGAHHRQSGGRVVGDGHAGGGAYLLLLRS